MAELSQQTLALRTGVQAKSSKSFHEGEPNLVPFAVAAPRPPVSVQRSTAFGESGRRI